MIVDMNLFEHADEEARHDAISDADEWNDDLPLSAGAQRFMRVIQNGEDEADRRRKAKTEALRRRGMLRGG